MSTTAAISNIYNPANSAAATTATAAAQQTLTQNDFLKLLVSQMQNQDPTNPQSDTAMAAQMAQFTAVTQGSAMSSSLSMLQANSLIGSTVTVQIDSLGDTTSGVVQSVSVGAGSSSGNPEIMVNGKPYQLSQVVAVTPTSIAPTSTGAATAGTSTTSSQPTN